MVSRWSRSSWAAPGGDSVGCSVVRCVKLLLVSTDVDPLFTRSVVTGDALSPLRDTSGDSAEDTDPS